MQRAKSDQNEARHVVGPVPQKRDRQHEHQHRANEPILHEGERQNFLVPEHVAHFLVMHLRQRRIHHQDQTDGDRDGSGAHAQARDGMGDAGDEVGNQHPGEHRQEDPKGEEAVEEGELLDRSGARFEQSGGRCHGQAREAEKMLGAVSAGAGTRRRRRPGARAAGRSGAKSTQSAAAIPGGQAGNPAQKPAQPEAMSAARKPDCRS